MKTPHILLLVPAVFIPLALIAQGPLTPPPGAPAPGMKTLQQVEPRIDVTTLAGDSKAGFLISAPGSYYLPANVQALPGKAGIAIASDGVSLDLNGFTINGNAAAFSGVELRNAASGATVRNGMIAGFTTAPGVGIAPAAVMTNIHLENLTIRNCAGGVILANFNNVTVDHLRVTGSSSTCLDLGDGAVATHCTVDATCSSATPLYGIRAKAVHACAVMGFANTGRATGIEALHVIDSSVTGLSGGAAGTAGIAGTAVIRCQVLAISNSATGGVTGIIVNGRVEGCSVDNIGLVGTGTAIGIRSPITLGCAISGVGNASSTGGVFGIDSSGGEATDCVVSSVGNFAAVATGVGINVRLASCCRVSTVASSGTLTGILANTVNHCSVDTLTQGATATSAATGISGVNISDCRVLSVIGDSAGTSSSFAGYRLASGCVADAVVNNGSGASAGFVAGTTAQTLHCVVESLADIGVSCPQQGCVVRGCNIRLSSSSSGTGIDMGGASGVIEDNTVIMCNTGISAAGARCLVVKNHVTSCTTNITSSATSQTGPVVTAAGAIASTSPWANFTD